MILGDGYRNINDRVTFVNNLAHCLFFELRCVFGFLHLHFSHSDSDNNICLLNWGNANLSAIKKLADRLEGKAINNNTTTAQIESSMPRNIQVRFMQPDPVGKPLVIDSN